MTYHQDFSRVGTSMLKVFRRSRIDYRDFFVTKTRAQKPPTAAMEVGTICHAVLLESKTLEDVVALYPSDCLKSDGSLNGKEAAKFRLAVEPKICVKDNVFGELRSIVDAMKKSPLAAAIEQASHLEHDFSGEFESLKLKCKPDIAGVIDDHVVVYDLKFVADPSPAAFARTAKRLTYWLQDAHYSYILGHHFGKPVTFRFFACEVTPPYRVQCYWYDARSRELARDAHQGLLRDLAECYETNSWHDDWPNELQVWPGDFSEGEQLVEFGEASDG